MQVNTNSKFPVLTSDTEKAEGSGNTGFTNVLISNSVETPASFMCGGIVSMLLSPVTSVVSTVSSYFSPVEPTETEDPYKTEFAEMFKMNRSEHIFFSIYPLILKASESSLPEYGKRRLWDNKSHELEALNINKQTPLIQKQVKVLCEKLNMEISGVLLLASVTNIKVDGEWEKHFGLCLAKKSEVESKMSVVMIDELYERGQQLIAKEAELT